MLTIILPQQMQKRQSQNVRMLPTLEDRQRMERAILNCIQHSGTYFDNMHTLGYWLLKKYRLKRLKLRHCCIRRTKNPGYIDIIPRKRYLHGHLGEHCPHCGWLLDAGNDSLVFLRNHFGAGIVEFVYGHQCGFVFGVICPEEKQDEVF